MLSAYEPILAENVEEPPDEPPLRSAHAPPRTPLKSSKESFPCAVACHSSMGALASPSSASTAQEPDLGAMISRDCPTWTNMMWEDYEVRGRRGVVARVYKDCWGKPLEREMAALDELRHVHKGGFPWAPRVVDHSWSFKLSMLLLERPPGMQALCDWCEDGERAPSRAERVHAWCAVGRALNELSQLGWVHSTLTPENVLVAPGDPSRVMLEDFAYATKTLGRHRGRDPGSWWSFHKGGSTKFSPPEQVKGGVVDHCADSFAWAGILYWMMTGREPEAPRDPCRAGGLGGAWDGCDEAEGSFFITALAADPLSRPHDFGEVLRLGLAWANKHYPATPASPKSPSPKMH